MFVHPNLIRSLSWYSPNPNADEGAKNADEEVTNAGVGTPNADEEVPNAGVGTPNADEEVPNAVDVNILVKI